MKKALLLLSFGLACTSFAQGPAPATPAPAIPASPAASAVVQQPAAPVTPAAPVAPAVPAAAAAPAPMPSPPAPVARGPAPPAPETPAVAALPADAPKVVISGGIYSESRSVRAAIVNGQVVHEGENIGPGVVLEQIRPQGVVLAYRGARYTVIY